MKSKSFLFINRKVFFGNSHIVEMLDVALIAASLNQHVHLAFLDDGVFQLIKLHEQNILSRETFEVSLINIADFNNIDHVWVERESLIERGLGESDLKIPITVIDRVTLSNIMNDIDVIVSV
ncbi:MAG: DsrE family protein [Rhodospirillaceae bacterium]|jgi:tRNA 2-thiouridine synthesizing protein C|nr:DsrE family protein [Rhodospirillaceae bacterium]